jgi:hypothetical protein
LRGRKPVHSTGLRNELHPARNALDACRGHAKRDTD